ncbi:Claudin-10 [Liparis tanakae]|uniref:Claudin-10 n=1 Tax=Liparis tanakae TaxID=230148 RepID=A0A4Z2H6H9_9TELE|nr:Claudin-10 [Liparis tanakae]
MKIRVVQIWGFLMTVLGWIFVACTMAMEGWKITSIGGMGGSSIIKVAWFWSSLWRSCFTDSTAVSNCYDYPVLWSVEGHVQIVRGLLMAALSLGMLGFVLSLLGMECTFLGGKDRSKHKKIYAGAWYDLGTPMFLGWVGSAFQMTGGFFYVWSVCRPLCGGSTTVITIQAPLDPEQNAPLTAATAASEVTSKTILSSVSELSSKSGRSDVSVCTRGPAGALVQAREERPVCGVSEVGVHRHVAVRRLDGHRVEEQRQPADRVLAVRQLEEREHGVHEKLIYLV